MNYYSDDFETTTQEEDCHVWCWSSYNIITEEIRQGKTIEEYYWYLISTPGRHYFHNLKFDGEFLTIYLLQRNYEWVKWDFKERPYLGDDKFSSIISGDNKWYAIYLMGDGGLIEIYDSYKTIPFKVSKIAKDFKLEESKGVIDYKKPRAIGYEPTAEEWEYVKNDVTIVGKAMRHFIDQGMTKMTIGGNALQAVRNSIGNKDFRKLFPKLAYDGDIRRAYKGAFTYLNPKYKNKVVIGGIVLDVNSLYSYVMRERPYPFGEGCRFEGKYDYDPDYPLYIQFFSCCFQVKKNHLPTLQGKGNGRFIPTEYLENSVDGMGIDDAVPLALTSVDFELFYEHYEVWDETFDGGWKFHAKTGLFADFIDEWNDKKIEAQLNHNAVMRAISKLTLNNSYGKFATRPDVWSRHPTLVEGKLKLVMESEKEHREPVYIPVGAYVTAYAREITIRAAQMCYDRFIYADTDSLHLEGFDMPNLRIHPYELGAWKHESTFVQGKYLRSKCYFECEVSDNNIPKAKTILALFSDHIPHIYYHPKITIAGMPEEAKKGLTFEKFDYGYTASGKLVPKHVPGGVILVDGEFTIKP